MGLHYLARVTAALVILLATAHAQAQTTGTGAGSQIAPFVQVPGTPGAPALSLAVDPHDGQNIYADGGGGRIARSYSRGENWSAVQVAGIYESFRAITVDPADPDLILAFSTSENDGGASAGVYISRDRGVQWLRLPNQPAGAGGKVGFGRGVLVDASGRSILLADKRQGIFLSTDFGATWTNPLPGSVAHTYTLVRDPNDARSFWAGGADSTGAVAVWVSHDVGQTWTESVVALGPALRGALVLALAIQPHSGRIVAGVDGFSPFGLGGEMLFSDDGGVHWTEAAVAAYGSGTGNAISWPAGNAIVFSSQSDSIAYASGNGTLGVLRSSDGGRSWTQQLIADNAAFFTLALAPAHAGQDERFFGAGSGTIQVSDDGGTSWTESDRGLSLHGIVVIAEDGRGGVYAQNGWGSLVRSDDGEHWLSIDPVSGTLDTLDLAVDPVASSHPLYALTDLNLVLGLSRSDDRGQHWSTLAAPLPAQLFGEQLLADPTRAGALYLFLASATPFNTVLQTTDFGATWQAVTIGVAGDFAAAPLPLAADPNHPGVLYAAMGSGLWKSLDFGLSWKLVPNLPLGLAGIAGLAVTSGPSGAVYVVAGADDGTFSLQRSHDGGGTWSNATSAFGTSPYVIFSGGAALFAYPWLYDFCADLSVLQSVDGANTWLLVDGNIESKFDSCLYVLPTAQHLFLSDAYGTSLTFAESLGGGGGEPSGAGLRSLRSGLAKSLMPADPRTRGAAGRSGWNVRFQDP